MNRWGRSLDGKKCTNPKIFHEINWKYSKENLKVSIEKAEDKIFTKGKWNTEKDEIRRCMNVFFGKFIDVVEGNTSEKIETWSYLKIQGDDESFKRDVGHNRNNMNPI